LRGIFEFRGFDDFGQQHFRGIQAEVTGAGLDSAMLCGVHRRFLPEYRCRAGCLWVIWICQMQQSLWFAWFELCDGEDVSAERVWDSREGKRRGEF
jgi:hypothetical protein